MHFHNLKRIWFSVFQACMFDIETIMEANKCTRENNFGFNEGQPCILLKMNKVRVKVDFRTIQYSRDGKADWLHARNYVHKFSSGSMEINIS